MKYFNIFWCIVFIVFAALQYNDYDPYIWIPIYGAAAILCWLAFKNRYHPKVNMVFIILLSVYAIYKVFDNNGLIDWVVSHHAENIAETMKAEKPWIEESREFFGLLIVIIIMAADYLYARRKVFSNKN